MLRLRLRLHQSKFAQTTYQGRLWKAIYRLESPKQAHPGSDYAWPDSIGRIKPPMYLLIMQISLPCNLDIYIWNSRGAKRSSDNSSQRDPIRGPKLKRKAQFNWPSSNPWASASLPECNCNGPNIMQFNSMDFKAHSFFYICCSYSLFTRSCRSSSFF